MAAIEKIVLNRSVNMGGNQPEPKGKAFFPPFEKAVQRAFDMSPHLFNVHYKMEAPPDQKPAPPKVNPPNPDQNDGQGGEGAAGEGGEGGEGAPGDALSAEEEEVFVKEWIGMRREATDKEMSFKDYVGTRLQTFRKASAETQEKARAKWAKFYPDEECPI